ncbi:MAG TPA: TrmH family RNA methyltransferase [Candidatus Yonathbacteria bacterium]|nr:TrmH family RNA methyltransferase [Candidatus Yonathbacteria bacterium]
MKVELVLILHNIRSVYNVGAIFRTADASGVKKIYLTGYTPTPLDRFGRKRKDVAKSALGAEEVVTWEQYEDPHKLIEKLKKIDFEIIALEQASQSKDYRELKLKKNTALLIGSEIEGLPQTLLETSDAIIEIPMRGKKESLNVSVAVGVALYELTRNE